MHDLDPGTIHAALLKHGYHILYSVAAGAFAQVYRVSSTKYPDAQFVAKVFHPRNEADLNARFEKELDIHKQLSHSNIVSVFDHFKCDSLSVMILEYCENGRIDQYVFRHRITGAALMNLLRQVSQALNYLHERGIAHRDIKPANILIDKYGRPKLADFGLSQFVTCEKLTHMCGTFIFMAPEVFCFNPNAFTDLYAADIWSLGVTFYLLSVPCPLRFEVCPGHCPYRDARLVIEGGFLPFAPGIVRPFRSLVRRMISLSPLDRPTIKEVLDNSCFNPLEEKQRIMPVRRRCLTLKAVPPLDTVRRQYERKQLIHKMLPGTVFIRIKVSLSCTSCF
jgi:serine/threonine protein kinase